MNFKINTKEKFAEVSVFEHHLSANMAAELSHTLTELLNSTTKNVILILKNVKLLDEAVIEAITQIHSTFYENNASFVICEIDQKLLNTLHSLDLTDSLNITPTLSEAWDMVQMEEVERELLDGLE